MFFDSSVPLVPQDTNGNQDVYEWEREGSGSCAKGAGATGGCIYLLSGGAGEFNSYLIGASADGGNVFIETREQLTPADEDETYNVFDARVDGIKPASSPECTGTGCQGVPAAPPTFATPASVTFDGVGNFRPSARVAVKSKPKSKPTKCKKGYLKKKDKCIKAKAKAKAKKSAKGRK